MLSKRRPQSCDRASEPMLRSLSLKSQIKIILALPEFYLFKK